MQPKHLNTWCFCRDREWPVLRGSGSPLRIYWQKILWLFPWGCKLFFGCRADCRPCLCSLWRRGLSRSRGLGRKERESWGRDLRIAGRGCIVLSPAGPGIFPLSQLFRSEWRKTTCFLILAAIRCWVVSTPHPGRSLLTLIKSEKGVS